MEPICVYHKADLDGVCSAAIVKRFVPDCELYGIDYGDEFPWAMPLAPNWHAGATGKTGALGEFMKAAGFVCVFLPFEP